jgi:hypothetical protein
MHNARLRVSRARHSFRSAIPRPPSGFASDIKLRSELLVHTMHKSAYDIYSLNLRLFPHAHQQP